MSESKSNAELDLEVANAIGLIDTHQTSRGERLFVDPRDGTRARYKEFHPSTDLNDAFSAADAVRLFRQYALSMSGNEWFITPACQIPWFTETVLGTAATPELAICEAVLKLKEHSRCEDSK